VNWQDIPCIEHDGYIRPDGYGWAGTSKYGSRFAHRVAWVKANGPVPDDLDLDHLCRNRACINVEHLEPVTRSENLRRGINKGNGKITVEDVKEIRKLYVSNQYSQDEIADMYGVSQSNISHIVNYTTWKD